MADKYLGPAGLLRLAVLGLCVLSIAGCSQESDSADPAVAAETSVVADSGESSEDTSVTVPTETDDSDIQVSTIADPDDEKAINDAGDAIVEAWWFNKSDKTYNDLADGLEKDGLITEKFATEWRVEGERQVDDLTLTVELVTTGAVRVEPDNATFQIASIKDGEDETVTYLEFVLEGDAWKLDEVAS